MALLGTRSELRWQGPLLDCSGYAAAGRGYLMAAEAAGIAIRAEDASRSVNLRGKGMDDKVRELYDRLSRTRVSPSCPTVQHQVPDQFHLAKSRLRIGYTIFEMTGVPAAWASWCNEMDAIWTGSEYSKQAFASSGVKTPIHVLPHAIDTSVFNEHAKPWPIRGKRSFAFLSVFDFTERKAWKDLLRAFWSAFGDKDDVCLVIKAYFGSFGAQAIRSVTERILSYQDNIRMRGRAPVLLYGHDVPQGHMPGLYRAADCYVGVSREGFGLPYAEAMACGTPCIGPEVGGTRQFMTRENSFLVDYLRDEKVGLETASTYPLFSGLKWARHSWEHLCEVMRQVVSDDEERQARARKGMDCVRASLFPGAVGSRMATLLKGSHGVPQES